MTHILNYSILSPSFDAQYCNCKYSMYDPIEVLASASVSDSLWVFNVIILSNDCETNLQVCVQDAFIRFSIVMRNIKLDKTKYFIKINDNMIIIS